MRLAIKLATGKKPLQILENMSYQLFFIPFMHLCVCVLCEQFLPSFSFNCNRLLPDCRERSGSSVSSMPNLPTRYASKIFWLATALKFVYSTWPFNALDTSIFSSVSNNLSGKSE